MKILHALAASAAVLSGAPAAAAVTYTFDSHPAAGFQGTTFSFTLNDYIVGSATVTSFDSCVAGNLGAPGTSTGTCESVTLTQSGTTVDVLAITSDLDFGIGFGNAELGVNGTYQSSVAFNNSGFSTLTISGSTSRAAVPEPATWAMMLFGFGGIGAAMRQSRRKDAMRTAV